MVTLVKKNKKSMFADYTKGSLHKHIFYILISLVCAAFARNLVQIVDMLFLSWLNDHSITAGVSASKAVLKCVAPVGGGMGVATGTIVGHYMGTQNVKGVKRLLVHAVTMSLTIGSSLCLLVYIFKREFFFGFLKGDPTVYPYFVRYLTPMLISLPLMNLNMIFTMVRSSIGDLKGTLYLVLLMSFINVTLDPLFIFVWHGDTLGAGLATLLSRVVVVIIGYLRFKYKFKVWSKIRPKKIVADIKMLLKYFIPATLTATAPSFFVILNIKIASSYGKEVVSTVGMISMVTQLCIGTMNMNMKNAVAPIVAQNYAKGEYDRILKVLKSAIVIIIIFMIFMTIFFNIGGSSLIAHAFHLKGLSYTLMVTYYNYVAVGSVCSGICFAGIGCLNAIGKPAYSTFLNLFRMVVLGVPLMLIFHAYLPEYADYLGFSPSLGLAENGDPIHLSTLLGPLSPYLGSMTAGLITSVLAYFGIVAIIRNLKKTNPHPNVGR